MRLGIRSKLFLLSFGLVAVVLLAADLLLTRALDRFLVERIRADLLIRAAVAERYATDQGGVPAEGPTTRWEVVAQDLGRRAQARLTFIAPDGRVLGDSEVAPEDIAGLENHGRRPEVLDALADQPGASVRHSATLGRRMLYVAVPMHRAGQRAGVLRLALPLSEVDRAVARFRGILVGASLGALALAALLSSLAVQWASRPLRRLTELSTRMAAGPAGAQSPATGDEVTTLGQSLDRLAADLSRALAQLRADHQLLEATFEGMQEGVMVVSASGAILHANPALRDMLLLGPDAVGRPLIDVLRNARLMELLDLARQRPDSASDEIEVGGLKPLRLLVQASRLAGRGDLLVVLVDVTQLRHLESVRRDFVANASHELRTPVASIRSAVETLQQAAEDPEARQAFLAIIARNAVRLHQLVDDLLDLSRIEAREYRLDLRPVELAAFAAGVAETFQRQAEARGMRIVTDPSLAGAAVQADRRALEQVLGNLLDNALKYAPGGTAVRVGCSAAAGRIRVRVEDQGPGIEPQHLPRLFERFYRVDAGRSRELGGTGLGLAIVKNLVEAMGGAVAVESQPGQGTTFAFTLPEAPRLAPGGPPEDPSRAPER